MSSASRFVSDLLAGRDQALPFPAKDAYLVPSSPAGQPWPRGSCGKSVSVQCKLSATAWSLSPRPALCTPLSSPWSWPVGSCCVHGARICGSLLMVNKSGVKHISAAGSLGTRGAGSVARSCRPGPPASPLAPPADWRLAALLHGQGWEERPQSPRAA